MAILRRANIFTSLQCFCDLWIKEQTEIRQQCTRNMKVLLLEIKNHEIPNYLQKLTVTEVVDLSLSRVIKNNDGNMESTTDSLPKVFKQRKC